VNPAAFFVSAARQRAWQNEFPASLPSNAWETSLAGGANFLMSIDLSTFAGLPDLRQWILSAGWKRAFDTGTLQRAAAYASGRMIRNLAAIAPTSGRVVILSASVHGTAPTPYRTEVRFGQVNGRWLIDPDCSCPMESHCKHAAALLLFTSAELSKIRAEAVAPEIQPELRDWLDAIDAAARVSHLVGETNDAKPDNRFLAFCVERTRHPTDGQPPIFVLRIGTKEPDGGISISSSRAVADPARPAKYLTPRDELVASLYHQRSRRLQQAGDMPLAGSGWDEILTAALATGHLFHSLGSSGGKQNYRPVTGGPAEQVHATWKILPSGGARPVLACDNPENVVIPTNPPRYLNSSIGVLGFLKSTLPPGVLAAWQEGPVVEPRNIPAVTERFARISSAVLPIPTKAETERRPPSAPRPHLRIYPRTLGTKSDSKTLIVGQLSFRYSDSALLTPLSHDEVQSHSELRSGRRIVWPRDFKAEQRLTQQLVHAGLHSLPGLVSARSLDAAAFHSFVPDASSLSQQAAWLEFLNGPAAAKLRAAGWTIEIDPKAGLTTHDATGFLPVIEADPDHGIDWFRFDISFEINGKNVSLIPIIAKAIHENLPSLDTPDLPEFFNLPCENPEDGFIRFPARRLIEMVDQVRHLFHEAPAEGPLRLDRLAAATVADSLAIDSSETTRVLAKLGHSLKNITALPPAKIPATVRAELRHYQQEGFQWLQFLAAHGLHGILADDMGLGKTLQTLAHLAAERAKKPGIPSLVIAPTSVVPNWAAEAEKFTPRLRVLTLHGKDRAADFRQIPKADVVLTSYPLLARDFPQLSRQQWHVVVLDEAQYIKNPKAVSAQYACQLKAAHRICLSGTPMENHLGELWSLMRFLMPGYLSDEKSFNTHIRRPIERDKSHDAQLALNRCVSPLILRRTKDQVATELPEKTELIHGIDLTRKQTDLYESVRAAMDQRVREAIADRGLAKSHIIVLDALLKLRQICCHPQLLKSPSAQKVADSAKLDYLTAELLPTLLEEGRRILLFSTFTSMLALIEQHLVSEKIPYLKLTGQTQDRASLVKKFQTGEIPIFLISLKAGGTGLNLTAADTVIHYDPWWNPAAENQATDRAHRIGQTKPVFVHKLVCRGTIEDRILDLQKHKSALVEALLSEETSKLRIDADTLSHLLAPLD
jgi:hypothetical protein